MISLFRKRYNFSKLDWTLDKMRTYRYELSQDGEVQTEISEAGQILSKDEKKQSSIRIESRAGKVTDAGYDQFRALYTAIPGHRSFTLKARIRVNSFRGEGPSDGQEGFGIFVRDTMKPDPQTGMYYSNMAAVGGYAGCLNFFGRCGITADSFEDIHNFVVNKTDDNDPPIPAKEGGPLELTVILERKGGRISAQVTDQNGTDLLKADGTQQLNEGSVPVYREKKRYFADLPAGSFEMRETDRQYIGFFAARGADIQVDTKSVRLYIGGRHDEPVRESSHAADSRHADLRGADSGRYPEKDHQTAGETVLYASPGGAADAAGTGEDPLDLLTAAANCPAGGEIRLLPGSYAPDRSIVLGEVPQEKAGGDARGLFHIDGVSSACARFAAETGKEERQGLKPDVIIDFKGTRNCLMISGDHRRAEGIAVTGGYGIWLTGDHNTVSGCHAFRNRETGILIRALRNDIPVEQWPADNLIEDCLSYENCDHTRHNADGFACKAAAGENNRFLRCRAYLNTDDGFDLFAKNRRIGAVMLQGCESSLNGLMPDQEGKLAPSKGNGNGFKLGGSGLAVRHKAVDCRAKGNRADGFTSNSNPVMILHGCSAEDNGGRNINYYYTGPEAVPEKTVEECTQNTDDAFDAQTFYEELRDSFL